jgi:hypothetical protein
VLICTIGQHRMDRFPWSWGRKKATEWQLSEYEESERLHAMDLAKMPYQWHYQPNCNNCVTMAAPNPTNHSTSESARKCGLNETKTTIWCWKLMKKSNDFNLGRRDDGVNMEENL